MIELLGLVNSGLEDMAPLAWRIYTSWEYAGQPVIHSENKTLTMAKEFKKSFSRTDVRVHFMGLWDSVNSVGILWDRMFPYTIKTANVDHIRHAISIDERRSKYKQQLFSPIESSDVGSKGSNTYSSPISYGLFTSVRSLVDILKRFVERFNRRKLRPLPAINNLIEVYFPGNHGDIGGGWKASLDNQVLSSVSLRWMLAHAIKYGVRFQPQSISQWSSDHPPISSFLSPNHDVLSFSSKSPDSRSDIVLPEFPIKLFAGRGEESFLYVLFWWILELIPFLRITEIQEDGYWKRAFVPNLGKHRVLPSTSLFHWSVFYRLHYAADYNPKNLHNLSLGEKFIELLMQFKIFKFNEIYSYSENLTVKKIKNDWTPRFWKKVPDELSEYLEKDANL